MKKLNLPTVLTILRIILVAPLMILIFMDCTPAKIASIVIFTVASLTDFIDGRLARKNKQVTDLGAFLDPLADKMLINLTFLALVVMNLMPVWMFGVILIRDFAVDGMRMMVATKGTVVSASIFGKLKTTVQMITVISILLNRILNLEPLTIINIVLLYIVVFLTVMSGAIYLFKGQSKLK
ncbi:CDP-diacylglycerol--glycerol-3-phosphate 3-phosphatidyltransferase [Candidatus Saccharibacteria bacterium]|nr:CDP-diacylglycerol--glycerol-3-phosphate 3-phosphatidyltransferase [Candidatus Saccharibacteria bacterium]